MQVILATRGSRFSQHVVAEINPIAFTPFRRLAERQAFVDDEVSIPDGPGIGFEVHREIWAALDPIRPEC